MALPWRVFIVLVATIVALALPAATVADHGTRPSSANIHALGHSPHPASFAVPAAERNISSDLAFWNNYAFQGNYDGFRVIDISAPGNPKLISHPRCTGDQGDVVVWENWVVRSWNSPAPAGRECGGEPVPEGFEGFHVFDISDVSDPQLVGSLELSSRPEADAFGCGSHTATAVPDLENDRLIIYNSTSGGPCPFLGVIELDLSTGQLTHLRDEPRDGPSHDVGVILGDANLMASSGSDMIHVFDISGSLENPSLLYTISEPGVGTGGNWHSAAFTWDGEVLIGGWEPGGGGQAECEAADSDAKKSMFFYDAQTGAKIGQWVLENAQGPDENCTIHNFNVVPLRSGNYVAVGGHYQAGTWVVDFTDPANASAIAWSDPESLGPGPFCSDTSPPGCQLGGAWSSYWYNGLAYESDITTGLNIFRPSHPALAGAIKLPHLNPQTQDLTLP